jgi:hypothetical protein
MKKNLSVRFSELIKKIRKWFKQRRGKDDNDWFDHPYAIF